MAQGFRWNQRIFAWVRFASVRFVWVRSARGARPRFRTASAAIYLGRGIRLFCGDDGPKSWRRLRFSVEGTTPDLPFVPTQCIFGG
jgi:hypothetical protein